VGRLQFASFIEGGLFQSLNQFIAADPRLDINKDAVSGIMFSGIYKGEVYGFPVYNGPALLFYNPTIFAQRGVAEPVDYVASDNWNRETFLQVAKKLTYDTAGRGTPTHFGYFGYTEWQPMWISYIRHAGGDAITSDRSGLNLPQTIESLEWLNDLNVLHGVTAHPGPGGASWESGTIAMHIRWQTTGLIEKNLYAAVDPEPAPIPAGPKGYAHLVGGVPACVATSAENPELAYQYAKWFGMESEIWKLRGGPPLSWKQVRGPEYRATLRAFKNPTMFDMALVGDARPEPEFGFVEYAEINNILANVLINPIRRGEVSVRAAVSEAHRLLTQVLEKR
jgi:ABC-type glycerol-3-phosphate transport system substrate-binding protein